MAKRIVAIYDRGIDKNLMQGFDVLKSTIRADAG